MHVSSIYLTSEQTDKLRRVLTPTIPIYPSPPTSSFPTLHIIPKDFLRKLLIKLYQHSIDIKAIRLHGGAASYVLINDSDFVYRDIDILFLINTSLSSQQQTTLFSSNNQPYLCDVWTIIKYIISSCLIEYIPNTSICTQYFISSVLDTYTKKNIKINSEQDSWALLSLQNLLGQNLELKFVENLKRQWQFSVDSFQIDIKPLLFENINQLLSNSDSITTKIQTKNLIIDAINGVTIIKNNHQNNNNNNNEHNISTSPLQFGFFSPSSLSNINEYENPIQCQTLATITTIKTSKNNNSSLKSRSRSRNPSESTVDDNDSNSSLQFQLSINEDVDDGIEVDADDSPNEDDDHVYHTPIDKDHISTISKISLSSNNLIEVFSAYKDLHQALYHLNNKLIATYEPETMRGGGLLKYCDLLARNYKLYDVAIMIHMQRYMCSRFFIDYKTIPEQIYVIAQYVATHFLPSSIISNLHITNNLNEILQHRYYQQNQLMNSKYDSKQIDQIDLINARLCLLFFEHLITVIQQSTVCLTHEDRELLFMNIHYLKEYYHYEYEHLFIGDNQHHQKYHGYNHLHQHNHHHYCTNSSTNSSRSSSPSSLSSKSYGFYRTNSHRNYYPHRPSTNLSYHTHKNYPEQQTVHRRNQS
ncbi:unnamed protein product [Rotaria sp. Silwood1]|nr:unnamed protein product [Rotaria sp. Silwood1]CAF1609798.1 unnamed protein product [Rotaria sp. Silwood1]CAF3795755.1 unnamed protein product [Rotaria sp. Silwood1]CAF3836364.1 unnamed protein product [Rotaria sp. Silwood1]CAF4799482.1 unnamed protein product [Rotaria sp. Silwood1]